MGQRVVGDTVLTVDVLVPVGRMGRWQLVGGRAFVVIQNV